MQPGSNKGRPPAVRLVLGRRVGAQSDPVQRRLSTLQW